MYALSCGLSRSMRLRQDFANSIGEMAFFRTLSEAVARVRNGRSSSALNATAPQPPRRKTRREIIARLCHLCRSGEKSRSSPYSYYRPATDMRPRGLRIRAAEISATDDVPNGPVETAYFRYYHRSRPHLALEKQCPIECPIQTAGAIIEIP